MRCARLLCLTAALLMVASCSGDSDDAAKPKQAKASPFASPGKKLPKLTGVPPATPSIKPYTTVTDCRTENLSMRLGSYQTSSTETSVTLYIKYARGPACTLKGYGDIVLFEEDGTEVKTTNVQDPAPAPTTIKIKSGVQAVKRLHWSNKPAAGEPTTGDCGQVAVVLSVRLTDALTAVDLYTKTKARPEGIGAVCNHGKLMHTAWRVA